MIEIESNDQRSFVRANLSFKVRFKVLTRDEYEEVREPGNKFLSPDEKKLIFESNDADEKFNGIAANQCLVDFLFHIDEKLDLILAALSKDDPDIALFNEGAGVDIGASGMKILVDRPVDPGLFVHLNLILSRSPLTFIDVFGEVVRSEPVGELDNPLYKLGIKFLDLGINDREKIISCVFQRQREVIRSANKER